jgi:hypothetical protein
MILKEGDKVLVSHRRLYPTDAARFFVGQVDAYDGGLMRVTGHSYVRNVTTGQLVEKTQPRTKLLSLSSGTLIVYLLPSDSELDSVRFDWTDAGLIVTDGKQFTMNLGEYAHAGGRE